MKKLTKAIAAIMIVLAAFVMLTSCNKPNSEKKILSFKFYEPAVEATIMESAKTVIATVPEGTNVTALVPVITVSENATINPASGVPQNFSTPKTYTVTAEDGTLAVYTVTVVIGHGGGDNGDDNGGGNNGEGGDSQTYTITTSANPADGGTVTGGGTYDEGASVTLRATANTNYAFDHWQDGNTANPRTITVTANASYTAYFTYNGGGGGTGDANGHAYVDLDLPSGTLWATCNVGATTPEGYGNYYAWGETSTKATYDWSTYRYCNGNYNTLTKYCNNSSYGNNGFTDNLTTLQLSDDAARANWGGDWRMPTKAEWEELLNNTTVTWMTQNSVNGRKFTASNGNSLFLPAAGYRFGSGLYYYEDGTGGYYWSSSLGADNPGCSWCLHFHSDDCTTIDYPGRYYGYSVRPVCSARQN